MKTSKKLLSFFLAVVMVITTCSVGFTAFAQDNSNSIWETSSDAEAAFNSLNGLADDYLPAVLINASPAISAPVYKKYAGEYKNADGTPKTADQLTASEKEDIANSKATLQDVLGALQPVLLNALGTSQEDYVTAVDGEDSQKDASYYDYLIKYKLDENGDPMLDSEGNPIVDDSSISFFSLYILCRDYRFNSELSKSTRDTLSEWYETLNQIANIDSSAVVKKYADMYAPIMNPTYDYATLYELECTFTDEFWETQVSAEDKLVLEALFDSYNTQYEEYSMGIKIDSLADLIYYCYGAGQNVKYAYAYYNLVHSTGTTVTFNKTTEDVTGTFGGQITYNIDEDITPENAADLLVVNSAIGSGQYPTLKPDSTLEDVLYLVLGVTPGEPLPEEGQIMFNLYASMFEQNSIDAYVNTVIPEHYRELVAGLAIKYSDQVNNIDDFEALVDSKMPANYETDDVFTAEEIKEIGSFFETVSRDGANGFKNTSTFFANGTIEMNDNSGTKITPTLPEKFKGTLVAEYFSLIFKDSKLGDTYPNNLIYAFCEDFKQIGNNKYTEKGTGNKVPNIVNYDVVRYEGSNLPVLNYPDEGGYDTEVIKQYIMDSVDYAYAKTAANLLGITEFDDSSSPKVADSVLNYKNYIDSQVEDSGSKVILTEDQKKILYADYDLTGEMGTELLNLYLNENIVSIIDLATSYVGALDGMGLDTALADLWNRVYESPVATIFEIVPVVAKLADELLIPIVLNNGEDDFYSSLGDVYTNILAPLLGNLLGIELLTTDGSYIGLDSIFFDLNKILPNVMNWLFEGAEAEGITYYDGSTKTLMTTVTVPSEDPDGEPETTRAEAVFSVDAGNINDIDFKHYNVADRSGNALTPIYNNGEITGYTYLNNTADTLEDLLADYADTEFLCSITYSSDVPRLTGVYIADKALRDADIADLDTLLAGALDYETKTDENGNEVKVLKTDENGKPIETPSATAVALSQAITEIAQLFRSAVNEFVNSERVNQHQYDANGNVLNSGLNNIFVAIPQLFDIMEDLAADKYGVSKDAWTYCYDGKIFVDENNSYKNQRLVDFISYASSTDPDRSVDILDTFADIFVNDWINAIISLVNGVISTDNSITKNIPIITGLLNSLGGFGEKSIITDVLNGVFQIDRESKYSFTFEEQETGLTGLTKDNAYFLISNIQTLVNVITDLAGKFGGSDESDNNNSSSSTSPTYKPKAAKTANADKSTYTNKELSNATDLINNLDKMLSSLLADSSFNGFNINSVDNILSGAVTFFSNYLGNDCFTDLGKLLNSYVFYITGSETYTPDKNGNVDAKKVYSNESLTGLVVETFLLIEKISENLLADYGDTYTLDNGTNAQYNLLVEAIEGVISPDAVSIRLDGYDKVQDQLSKYNCWHNAADQTSRGDYKIKLDWGIKAGDKDAFYDALAASLRLVTSILGVVMIDTNWYANVVSPVLGALCTKNGIKIDTAAQYAVTTNGYHDEVLLGLLRPISEWLNLFLDKPATTLIKSVQGIAGILDDKNGATIASIVNGAVSPLVKEINGLGEIFAIVSDELLPTSLKLKEVINGLADKLAVYADANNIKLGQGNYKYSLSGDNLIPIINSYIASTGITLKKINWNKLSTAKTPAAALVYVLEYVIEVLLDNDNLTALAKLIGNDTVTQILDLLKAGDITAQDLLSVLNKILEATDSPTLAYWTFSQYLQEAATGFYYPAGITKQMADNGVEGLDNLIAGIFPLLSSFGVDLGADDLQGIINNNLFTNEIVTKLATALYGALDGLDPNIKQVLKVFGIVTSTKDVAKLLTDKSYGKTFTSAANTIKAQSSWSKVKNVNWGFKDGSANAQQGFVNALAAVLRPLSSILNVLLNEGTLELNDNLYNLIKSLDVPYTVQIITISDDKEAPIKLKFSYRMKDGVLRMKFREYEDNRERSKSSELRLDFSSLNTIKDLKIEGTNGYNSAIIPLLEALGCSNISTYKQYQSDANKAKDNLLLNILNPLVGDSSSSFLNKLAANPVDELTKVLPNVAMYLDSHGLSQLVNNLLAPITDIIYEADDKFDIDAMLESVLGDSLGNYLEDLLGMKKGTIKIDFSDLTKLNLEDLIVPLINKLAFQNSDNATLRKLRLDNINWNALISLGDPTTYTSKATGSNGKYLTGKTIENVDQGKVLITFLRYVADFLVDNASPLKNLICSIDAVAKNDTIKSVVQSVFNTLSTSTADQIVAAVFFLLAGNPENAFWDYTSYETGKYSFSYPENMDVDFLKQLPPMLDGLIGSLADLNGLISEALFKDELISKLATGLYGAIEGVKINDGMNLTQLLAKTDIDFSTSNVAKLLVDERYGQKFESASATIAAAGSWSNVNVNSLKWGVTDRDSFFHALVAVLRPLYGVLDVLLNDAYLGLFDIVRLPGSNGYTSSIVPLMEAFSMYNIKTQYQYRQDINEEYDAILLDIINPLWDLVEDVLAAPLQTVAAIIPNLALFIGNDGLCQIIDNLLTPVSAIVDAIRPVVDLNDLLTTLFDALDVDINGILAKIGVTNFSLDIYDLNKTLKPILSGDAIIPLVNNILGMIDINGTKLDLKLNPVDWLQLASHGTTVVSASQAATYGSRIFVQGDSSETLIAVLRYLINTINTGDNLDKISSLIGGLLGDGVDDNVSGIITQVLGMLKGDTDEVISSLVELLQQLGS